MHKFCEKKLQFFCRQPVKGNLHIFSFFSWLKIRLFKILQIFLHIYNGMVKGFSKMNDFSFFGHIFLQAFLLHNWILQWKIQFLQTCKFFADSKTRAQELSKDVLFVIFGHQTWNLGGGGANWPPPSISWCSSTPTEKG